MSTVAQDVQQIREAIYGREVREAIADGIEHCYSDVSGGVTTANTAAAAANAAAQRANTAAAGAEGIPGTASLEDVNYLKSALNTGYTDLGYSGELADCTSVLGNDNIIGQQYLFDGGFVNEVRLNCSEPTTDGATLIICDENMKVMFKSSKMISASDQTIPVNRFFDTPFYVLLSCKNIKYLNNNYVKSTQWMGISFATYGGVKVGDTLAVGYNNTGYIGFGIEVHYNSVKAEVNDNTNAINVGLPNVVDYDNRVLFNVDNDGIVTATKSSRATTSGLYKLFFDSTEKMTIHIIANPVWVIISKNTTTGKFVALGMQNNGVIFAEFNPDGSVDHVDTTYNFIIGAADSWTNYDVSFVWEDDYFLSIYRNGEFIWKLDIRHISTDTLTHQLGVGLYSNQIGTVALAKVLPFNLNTGNVFDTLDVLGDSFTDNTRDALGEGTFYFTRWYEFAKTICKMKEINNYGFGGTTMSPYVSGDNSFYNRMMNMSEYPSAVFVLGGTNDYHFDVPLGTIDDTTTDTFYGTLNKMCEWLKDERCSSSIVFCTPIMRVSPAQNKTEAYPANEQTNNLGFTLEQYVNAMLEVCAKWAIPCFDAYHESGIDPERRNTKNFAWYMNDGIHPNQRGHRRLGMRFGNFAKNYLC